MTDPRRVLYERLGLAGYVWWQVRVSCFILCRVHLRLPVSGRLFGLGE